MGRNGDLEDCIDLERCEECLGFGWIWVNDSDWPNSRWREDCDTCDGVGVVCSD